VSWESWRIESINELNVRAVIDCSKQNKENRCLTASGESIPPVLLVFGPIIESNGSQARKDRDNGEETWYVANMEFLHDLSGQEMLILAAAASMVWTSPWPGAVVRFTTKDQTVDIDFLNIKFDIRRPKEDCVESVQNLQNSVGYNTKPPT
jgi:hypothetical protein